MHIHLYIPTLALVMLLTPFIDFGSFVEYFVGNSSKPCDENIAPPATCEKPISSSVSIVCVTNKLNLSLTDSGTLLSGSGIAIVSGPLDQSKAYFEIHIEEDGTVIGAGAVGGHPNTVLSWNQLSSVPNTLSCLQGPFSAGTRLGVLINIANFPPAVTIYKNDTEELQTVSTAVRGDVWPGIEIRSGSARVVLERSQLVYLTPERISRGVEAVMISRAII